MIVWDFSWLADWSFLFYNIFLVVGWSLGGGGGEGERVRGACEEIVSSLLFLLKKVFLH